MTTLGKRVLALLVAALVGVACLWIPPAASAGTGTISGKVTTAGGGMPKLHTQAQVQVLAGSTWTVVENAYTDYWGAYTSEALAPGTYRVEFSNMDYRTHVTAPVTVSADGTVVVNHVLDPGANIQGRFTVPAGGPAADGMVRVFEKSSSGHWVQVDHGLVDPNGTYVVSGLAGGSYKVGFGDFKGQYATEYYDNVATLEQARVLVVPSSGSATGIDVVLSTEALPVPAPPVPAPTRVTITHGPHISGKMRVGQRVKATIGTVSPAAADVRYAWLLDGRRIKGATKRSLRLQPAMRGRWLSVKVVATAPGLQRWVNANSGKRVRGSR